MRQLFQWRLLLLHVFLQDSDFFVELLVLFLEEGVGVRDLGVGGLVVLEEVELLFGEVDGDFA